MSDNESELAHHDDFYVEVTIVFHQIRSCFGHLHAVKKGLEHHLHLVLPG